MSGHHPSRNRSSRWICAVVLMLLTADRGSVRATNDENHLQELMAGANGNSKIQFVVIKQEGGGNCWGPQRTSGTLCFSLVNESQSRVMLVFFDAVGREIGKFKFASDPPDNSAQVLVATQQFASLPGAPTPNFIMPPLMNPISGKVCFTNNTSNSSAFTRNDCVSYGSFTGSTGTSEQGLAFGPPTSALTIVDTVSLKRDTGASGSVTNSHFVTNSTPTPRNNAGATFTIPVSAQVTQGETLFNNEIFGGNGRTCGSCHAASESFRLPPSDVSSRFGTVSTSFDPLFVAETKPSSFDGGFDFNLNTLVLTAAVTTASACIGELRGTITTSNGAKGKVLGRISGTTYLIYGGKNPTLTGTVTDNQAAACSGTVSSVTSGGLGAIVGSGVAGLEDPLRMRSSVSPSFPQGRALILENIDGVGPPLTTAVFRKSPHLLNLNKTAPYGFSGDVPDLQTFAQGAVIQHFTRTLTRTSSGSNPDFRLPTAAEKAAMEAFMLAQEFPAGNSATKFDLDQFATTDAQRRGRTAFFGSAKCSQCHGGTVLAATTVSILGKAIGINAAFNTGVVNQAINGPDGDNNLGVSCEKQNGTGACGSREFSVPQLFNLKNLGPFFHDASSATVQQAVDFYNTTAFNNSPAGVTIGGISLSGQTSLDLAAFLNGLVTRTYTRNTSFVSFGIQSVSGGQTAVQNIVVTNNGSSALSFSNPACSLTGTNPGEFVVVSCPTASLAAGQNRTIQVAFDPSSAGAKSAILEINASSDEPAGVDLSGTGATGFSDDPVIAQSTVIKAVHITELRTRINAARTKFCLSSFTFTDASLAGMLIKEVHITQLRTALIPALVAAGRSPAFTDDPVTGGQTVIKAPHISELRLKVQDLESVSAVCP